MTVAVWAIATALMVAEMVLMPDAVELKVAVKTPLALAVPLDGVSVFPAPVATTATLAPGTTVPLASRAVTVTVLVAVPALAVIAPGAATTVDWLAETVPAVTLKAVLVAPVRPVADAWSV